MTERIRVPNDEAAAPAARRRFALQLLGVGLFVSVYLHGAAWPALQYLAPVQAVRLFAPQRDRASLELTLSLPSRTQEASPEIAVRTSPRPESLLRHESESGEDGRQSFDVLTAAPANLDRTDAPTARVLLSDRRDLARIDPQGEAVLAPRVAPRPLARRDDSTATHASEQVGVTPQIARSRTVDSPPQLASEIRVGAEAKELPELIRNPPPIYPPDALKAGIEGRTIVRARIGRAGEVLAASIEKSSGSSLLDEAALRAVRSWTFRPALQFGLAVEQEVGVPVDFRIEDAVAPGADSAGSSARAASASR